ncbi:MAG: hypothetical protein L6N95_03215 [Candidatus Methylarchaceae archaeon HK01B]|nr:hypothetical protein [Candidatus Methylarchaceae archaeon HK01M]MCP8311351.1 hypothetical protein [Candidatus Methylarchaceae archaeon HK02M1]MCP8318819.1 hypothetical protein [Candidatus Methylarchaceae archaeon HK01B]
MLKIEDVEKIALDFVKGEEPLYEDEFATAGDAGIIEEWVSVNSVSTRGPHWVVMVERGHCSTVSINNFETVPIKRIIFWRIVIDEAGKVVEYQKIPAGNGTLTWKR